MSESATLRTIRLIQAEAAESMRAKCEAIARNAPSAWVLKDESLETVAAVIADAIAILKESG